MPTIQVSHKDLLEVVKQLQREEFDAFIEEALALRGPRRAATLSAEESKLMKRINRGLPVEMCRRHAHLAKRRDKASLTSAERRELLRLSHEAESRDADRAVALVKLASLRRLPVRTLMKQMGIQPPSINA